jgi:diguanylate cyclase (GGDEF)-like protein
MHPDALAFDRAPVPVALPINPRAAAAFGALVLATLLVGLFVYRRRPYILQWAMGWLLIAGSLVALAHDWTSLAGGRAMVGLSQLLNVCAAVVFVLSADSFRQRPRVSDRYFWLFVPLLLWFGLAPMALGVRSVLWPGYLLSTGMYATAAIAYILLLKRTRLIGAAGIGVSFMLIALIHAWLLYDAASNPAAWNSRALVALVPASMFSVVAGLGMHVLVFEDITWELRKTNRRLETAHGELEQLVITDALTGCHNRRFFQTIIGRELQRRQRYGTPLSVLFVDVDKFKVVNDTMGHEGGDAALRMVADFLRANVREADYLFRWGGDEFVVLISCSELEAKRKAEDLRRGFSQHVRDGRYPPGFGLSVGAAGMRSDTENPAAIIKEADERMYREKTRARRRARA